jgi:hypothetical protein
MTDKWIRTTVRLTPELDEAVKQAQRDGFVLSSFVRQQLERYFDKTPEFIKDQLENVNNDIEQLSKFRDTLTDKYKQSIELEEQRKERLKAEKPKISLYRPTKVE